MTQSMTGFARGSVTTAQFTVIVELRSVNNRFLDVHFRCPDNLRENEPHWRQLIGHELARGKVEVSVKVQTVIADDAIYINEEKLAEVQQALITVCEAMPDARYPNALAVLEVPGVSKQRVLDEKLLATASNEAIQQAVTELAEQHRIEGEKMARAIMDRVDVMHKMLDELKEFLPELRKNQRQRLLDRLNQAGITAEPSRLEEELVYLAQRSDVDEEVDRLAAHLSAISEALASHKPCGRRLDFLMQELNREANTLSAKSTALSTTNTAVEFKVLIEQMREQIQNIE
jgi:uncharacterized protein (TIGR00255 family)